METAGANLMRPTWREVAYETGWGMRPTPVVKWLLILNFGIFCLQGIFFLIGNPAFQDFFQLCTGVPLSGAGTAPLGARQGCLWQFFTYMFLHAGPLHLIFNLLMLYIFGNDVETELGSRHFLRMYLLGGLIGGLLWYVFNFHKPQAMVGASGAIYAVVIAYATLFPNRPLTLFIFIFPVTLLARYWAIVAVAVSAAFLLSWSGGGVAELAHLGGMAVGYLYLKAFNSSWSLPRFPLASSFHSKSHLRGLSRAIPLPTSREDFMSKKIDPILDKIAEQGINSLTREERRLLEEAKDRLP